MKTFKYILILVMVALLSCNQKKVASHVQVKAEDNFLNKDYLITYLDTIWQTEQNPIRTRDTMIKKYGADSEQAQKYQEIYKRNHAVNEKKISALLDQYGWPDKEISGQMGNVTICNVIQHSHNDIRLKYLPMMKQAVKDKKLEARFLVRAEDRIATERGDLQIYGGQMKYYPETKSFNVWPVYDPANVDKKRAEIGLGPIAPYLKNRFNFEWNLEEQIKRTAAFEKEKQLKSHE